MPIEFSTEPANTLIVPGSLSLRGIGSPLQPRNSSFGYLHPRVKSRDRGIVSVRMGLDWGRVAPTDAEHSGLIEPIDDGDHD